MLLKPTILKKSQRNRKDGAMIHTVNPNIRRDQSLDYRRPELWGQWVW